MKKLFVGLFFSLFCIISTPANDWYVAANGSSVNNGSQASPWDLQTALNGAAGQIQPGDNIWMLPGTYVSTTTYFLNNLIGTAAAPIIIRDYNEKNNLAAWLSGQRAVIDATNMFAALYDLGSYTWFWGFEITQTGHVSITTSTVGEEAFGVYAQGPGSRFVNLVVHDTTQGFSSYNPAFNAEYSDNLSYFNGYSAPDRNHGHGFYLQNSLGTKVVANNYVFDNADEGLQVYGSGNATLTGITVQGNTSFDNSSWPAEHYQYNILVGNGTCNNDTVTNNYFFFIPSYRYGFNNIGQYGACNTLSVTNNVFVGGYAPMTVDGVSGPFTFTGNTVYDIPPDSTGVPISLARVNQFGANAPSYIFPEPVQNLNGYVWDNNSYFGDNAFELGSYVISSTGVFSESGSVGTFSAWQANTGFDAHSTYANGTPATNSVYIMPNRYESKRAGITILNWQNLPTVAVDLSSVLAIGDPYVIQDVQNFFGPSVASGTYQGGTVSVPMTGLVKATVIGLSPAQQPPHTAPLLGTFMVLSANSANITPPPQPQPVTPPNPGPTPPLVSMTAPKNGAAISATITLSASASSNVGIADVQFLADGVFLGTVTSPPYTMTLETTALSNATHQLTAVAVDETGNQTTSASVTVTVKNVFIGPTTGLAGYWSFDPSYVSGTTMFDQSGNNENATSYSTLSVPGAIGQALQFDGSSSYLQVPSSLSTTSFDLMGDLSLSLWVQTTNSIRTEALISKFADGNGGYGYLLRTTSSGTLQLLFGGANVTSGNTLATDVTAINDGNWHQITVVIHLGISVAFYVDRTLSSIVTINSAAGTSSSYLQMGLNPSTSYGTYFTGNMDEVRIYNRALSASEIASLVPAVATFVPPADTLTQGSWQKSYGSDGYVLAVVKSQKIPSYATFAVQSASTWTWAASTSDIRALQIPGGAGGIAAAWYQGTTFSFGVNVGAGSHEIALYAMDWDAKGRTETIQIVDANNPGNQLDSRTLSNFNGGVYLVWNISGSVIINVTANAGPNAVVSGVFFGGITQTPPAISSVGSTTFTVGLPGTFTVTATGYPTPALGETVALPSGVTFTDNGNGTATISGTPATISSNSFSITASNGISPNGTQNFTLTVNPQVVTPVPTAGFVKADTATQGNWIGVYGGDGYDLASGPQSPAGGQLSYGTYAVQGQLNWTWAASSSDKRALETNGQGGRIAATWYKGATFSFDVNVTGTHQVALYVLDWDNQGRTETVNVVDAGNPSNVLDTRKIPNLNTNTTSTNVTNGTYLVWNISGHVTITITPNSGPNAVVAGIFFGTTSETETAPAITSASSTAFTAGSAGTFTVTAQGYPTPALSETGTLPNGITFIDNGNGTATLSGTPTTISSSTFSIAASNGVSPNGTQTFTLTVNSQGFAQASAGWARSDTSTKGTWTSLYGSQGYSLATSGQNIQSILIPATFAVQNQLNWVWASSTTDPRALITDSKGDRMAATWYSGANFTLNLNLTDGQTHQAAIYVTDWDSKGRAETVSIADAGTGNVLDTRSIPNANSGSATYTGTSSANFTNGTYLIWNVSGSVKITVTPNAGPNAVVSGVFLDVPLVSSNPTPPSTPNCPPTTNAVVFNGTDTTTQGAWKGLGNFNAPPASSSLVYGKDGVILPDTEVCDTACNPFPSYVSFGPGCVNSSTPGNVGAKPNSTHAYVDLVQGGTNFTAGEAVQVELNAGSNLNVRSTPDATQTAIGSVPPGTLGIIVSGPVTGGSYTFWYVNWAGGLSGYVVQSYIVPYSGVLPTPWPPISTTPPPPVPFAPGTLSATVSSSGTPTLLWTASPTSPVTYIVSRGTATGGPYTQIANGVSVLTYTDTSALSVGVPYYYVVAASDSAGVSFNSNEVACTNVNCSTSSGVMGPEPQNATNTDFFQCNYTNSNPAPPWALMVAWRPTSDTREISNWYTCSGTTSFYLEFSFGNSTHNFEVYVVDDQEGVANSPEITDPSMLRSEEIQVLDGDTNAVLYDSGSFTNFAGGVYYKWSITGHVKVKVINTSINGTNAVINGAFFN